jgi:flagellar protein FliJ
LPKFHFNLQALLQHREDLEQKERDELLRRNYHYQKELRHHDELVAKFRETMNEMAQKQSLGAELQELNLFYRYFDRLTSEIKESEKCLQTLQKEIQVQTEIVIEASKKKKVLATLKEKRQKEFVLEMDKLEQKEVDDLVVVRYAARESGQQGNS